MQDLRTTLSDTARVAPHGLATARGRRGRVHWTEHERAQLVQAAARRLSSLQARSRLDALRQAQLEVLPPQRRRRVAAVTGLTWFLDGLDAETSRLQQRINARSAAESPAAPAAPNSIADLVLLAAPLLRRAAVDLLGDAVEAALCRVLRSLPSQGLLARTRRAGARAAR
ncbi:MAG: hypothetical protein MUC68_16005 [Burkholderiaceae bacterium]|jgi:hypothetical protein|nr:hypothetical protein [Burkholderiaceae bacterium]